MGGASRDGIGIGREHGGQAVELLAVEFGTAPVGRHFGALEEQRPQPTRQVEGAHAAHCATSVGGKQRVELAQRGGGVGRAAPADEQRAAMTGIGQQARTIGREAQHTRPTHALARDEQRPLGAHFRSAQRERHFAHRHAREGGERRRFKAQAEERRAGGSDLVTHGAPRGEGFGARQTAAGHRHLREGRRQEGVAVPIGEQKRAVGLPFHSLHVTACAQFHADALQVGEQGVDHGVRLLRSGENAPFGLDAQRYADRFPPLHEGFRRGGAQQAAHQARTARIHRSDVVDVGKSVGHIAPAAARAAHFGERRAAAFENHYRFVRQKRLEAEGK